MNRRPLTFVACCWITGSGLACLYDGVRFWLVGIGFTLVVPLLTVVFRLSWRSVAMLWLIFCLGAGYWAYNDHMNQSLITSRLLNQYGDTAVTGTITEETEIPVKVQGTIISNVETDGDRVTFTISSDQLARSNTVKPIITKGEKIAVQLRLESREEQAVVSSWHRGRRIELSGTLEQPGQSRNFGGFDYRSYLRVQRIHWIMQVSGTKPVKIQPGELNLSSLVYQIDSVRAALADRVQALFPGWQGGYMKGMLIGFADELEPQKYEQFTGLGLSHILAISGSHVAINVAMVFWLLRKFRLTRESTFIIVQCLIPFYVLITGFTPSVIRAGIMTMLGLYLLKRGWFKDGLNILSAAALMMLLWNPYYLISASFQLSFAVTAGLIVFVPLLTAYFRWLPKPACSTVSITLAAQLVSFPLTIYYFNQFSLLSFTANILIVPVISIVTLPLGTAALLLSCIYLPLGQWIAIPIRLLNSGTFILTDWLNERSDFMTYWKTPALWWIALFYICCYLLLYLGGRNMDRMKLQALTSDVTAPLPQRTPYMPLPAIEKLSSPDRTVRLIERHRVKLRSVLLVGLSLLICFGYHSVYEKGIGYVEFLDVGQGDCALITTPEGLHILVDGGGTVSFRKPQDAWRNRREPYEVGAKTVVPLLKKRGIHRLNAVIVTHGDQDHAGGLAAVLKHFPVDAVLMNGSLSDTGTIRELMADAVSKNIPVYSVSRGMGLRPDQATEIHFLYPLPAQKSSTGEHNPAESIPVIKEQNHQSIVFMLKMGEASFLFTGDMDIKAEQQVLQLEQENKMKRDGDAISVDFMKIAHHGSKTSTSAEWLAYWRPAISVISVGAANSYGHPNQAVVERLGLQGSRIYRTDHHGEVQIKVNGKPWIRHKRLSEYSG